MAVQAAIQLKRAEEQAACLRLYAQGHSYRAIAPMLPGLGLRNVSYRTVARYVKQALDEMVPPAADEARTAELARLDALAEAIASKVTAGDLDAIKTALRIGESRRRLLGLDAPVKVDANVTVMPSEVIDLVAEARQRLAATLTRPTPDQPALPAPTVTDAEVIEQ